MRSIKAVLPLVIIGSLFAGGCASTASLTESAVPVVTPDAVPVVPSVAPPVAVAIPPVFPTPRQPDHVTLTPTATGADQSLVDTGALVTWWGPSDTLPCLVAGHNTAGWFWIDDLARGTIVNVTDGPCAGAWRVVGNRYEPASADPYTWIYDHVGYLLLQTCTDTGYGYSIAERIGALL